MTGKLKLCFWPTTFQANIWSLARYCSAREDIEAVTVVENLDQYLAEPINKLSAFPGNLIDRDDRGTMPFLKDFKPHVTVVDNHYPHVRISPNIVNVWHGFGWKGPEDARQFRQVYKEIKKHTGKGPDKPNEALMWITAGETNREYRIKVTGFHPENVFATGQTYTDAIVSREIDREEALRFYPRNFKDSKIFLFAPTWHFGKIFSHWGDDIEIINRMIRAIEALGGCMILRMHDRKRFDPEYLARLEALQTSRTSLLVKFKNENQDNLLDMVVAHCMISNYSSMLTFFYGTSKPSIHIYPVAEGQEKFLYRVWKRGKVREIETDDRSFIWSLDPEENGGLVCRSEDELIAQIAEAADNPDCCKDKSKAFIAKHCAPYDGKRCEKVTESIEERFSGGGIPSCERFIDRFF